MTKPFHDMTHRQQREFYKKWIREKPCCWCGSHRTIGSHELIHASHHNETIQGPSGTGRKSSDFRVIPLCAECHLEYHNQGTFRTSSGMHLLPEESSSFIQKVTIDYLVEFMERMINPEVF